MPVLDDGTEALNAGQTGPRRRVFGCSLLLAALALSTTVMQVDLPPGQVEIDGKVADIPGERVDCQVGVTIAASSEAWTTVVAYYLPATDRVYTTVVDGAVALTSAGAVKPTAAVIAAALPANAKSVILGDVKFVRDSGTVVTATIDHSRRPFGVVESAKTVTSPEDSDDAALYRPWGQIVLFDGLAATIANGDLLTNLPLPLIYGKIRRFHVICTAAITTAAKTTDLNLEKGTTDLTGTLTYASTKALGEVASQEITDNAASAFKPGDTVSLEAAATTAFVEGSVRIVAEIDQLVA